MKLGVTWTTKTMKWKAPLKPLNFHQTLELVLLQSIIWTFTRLVPPINASFGTTTFSVSGLDVLNKWQISWLHTVGHFKSHFKILFSVKDQLSSRLFGINSWLLSRSLIWSKFECATHYASIFNRPIKVGQQWTIISRLLHYQILRQGQFRLQNVRNDWYLLGNLCSFTNVGGCGHQSCGFDAS